MESNWALSDLKKWYWYFLGLDLSEMRVSSRGIAEERPTSL